jgi:hypothetical protein
MPQSRRATRIIFVLGLVFLFGTSARAEFIRMPTKPRQPTSTEPKPRPKGPLAPEVEQTSVSSSSDLVQTVGGGLPIVSGHVGFEVHTGAFLRLRDKWPLYVGAEAGINFLPASATGLITASLVGFHFLPTVYWVFDWKDHPTMHPYLGFAPGVNYLVTSIPTNLKVGQLTSPNKLTFQVMLEPGMMLDLDNDLAISGELRMGLLSGSFVVAPEFSFVFTIGG